MYAQISSFGVNGVGGFPVSVEVNMSQGLPSFDIVGLPDASVKEAKERVRAAIKNNGYHYPASRMTVNLAPADMKKAGTVYDLPIFIGTLAVLGEIKAPPADSAFIGELSLTGELRAVSGVLPMAIAAMRCGIKNLYVPADNANEAAFADGVDIYSIDNVAQLVRHLNGGEELTPVEKPDISVYGTEIPDFADVKGQEFVKRAMEVAAAGGHNILIVGPPGAGKSMMAKRLPGILPDMTKEEMIETTEIHSVAGLTSRECPIVNTRPFRSPHHTISPAGLSGGGSVPRPGEISLAHNGVLFLDELPEFRNDVLEVLRQPLEDGEVTVSRVSGSTTFPSRFMLVCAMNPCKCGWYGHPSGRCRCSFNEVKRYLGKISGPLLDRIDIIIEVPALDFDELKIRTPAEPSSAIKARVNAARRMQHDRYLGDGTLSNAHIGPKEIREYCRIDQDGEELMREAFDTLALSARSYDRILRVARTIADLAGCADILPEHLAEAIQYRSFNFRDI